MKSDLGNVVSGVKFDVRVYLDAEDGYVAYVKDLMQPVKYADEKVFIDELADTLAARAKGYMADDLKIEIIKLKKELGNLKSEALRHQRIMESKEVQIDKLEDEILENMKKVCMLHAD